MVHDIKIKEQYADAIIDGRKTFEVRLNDRGYNAGDEVRFKVFSDDRLRKYTHPIDSHLYVITYVHSGYGLEKDFVVFGIEKRNIDPVCDIYD